MSGRPKVYAACRRRQECSQISEKHDFVSSVDSPSNSAQGRWCRAAEVIRMASEHFMGAPSGPSVGMGEQPIEASAMQPHMNGGGHLYMQTNEIHNAIVHYRRGENGALEEVDRISTGGPRSGKFKPTSGQESAPNAFECASSVILLPDRRFLFATNGGDNSVSGFAVGEDGRLTVLHVWATGNPVQGRSGTTKSVAYAPETSTLYVLHSFGPEHLRLISVSEDGN
jgi:hypothetical protein